MVRTPGCDCASQKAGKAGEQNQILINTMAYKISEDCVACGTCKGECPQDAIVEGDIYSINPDICVDCGTCADVCPMGAISPAE